MSNYFKRFLLVILVVLPLYIMVGCGGTGSSGVAPSNSNQTLFPVATIVNPANNTVNVSTLPKIKVGFNIPVTNVNLSTVTLHQGNINGSLVEKAI